MKLAAGLFQVSKMVDGSVLAGVAGIFPRAFLSRQLTAVVLMIAVGTGILGAGMAVGGIVGEQSVDTPGKLSTSKLIAMWEDGEMDDEGLLENLRWKRMPQKFLKKLLASENLDDEILTSIIETQDLSKPNIQEMILQEDLDAEQLGTLLQSQDLNPASIEKILELEGLDEDTLGALIENQDLTPDLSRRVLEIGEYDADTINLLIDEEHVPPSIIEDILLDEDVGSESSVV